MSFVSLRSFARVFSSLSFALVVASGCKPGAQDLCERYAKAQCGFQYNCCNASERGRVGQGLGVRHYNYDTCVEELTLLYCAVFAVYADAETEGRATWNYEASNACLQTLEGASSSCDAESMLGAQGLGDDCDISEFITGTVADDDTCYEGFECANEEAVCAPNEPEDEDENLVSEKGTCTPPPGVGDECPSFVCTESAWCDVSEDPPTCKAKKPNDEECGSGLECTSNVCDFAGGAGVCAAKKPVGEPCFVDGECVSEFCDDVSDQCADKRPSGEPCDDNAACQSDYCDFANGECAELGQDDDTTFDICSAEEQ